MPTAPPQVAILGWYGSPNVGDEAVLESILTQLATLPAPPCVVVLSTQPAATAAHYAHLPLILTTVPRSLFASATRQALRASRLLILGGGGLIQDRSSIYNLAPYAAVVRQAYHWGIPVQWWGIGVEPLVTALGRALARRMVAWSAPGAVSLRDPGSRDMLVRAGVPPAAVHVTADPALLLPPAAPDDLVRLLAREGLTLGGTPHVAICLRNLPRDPLGRGPGYLLPVSVRTRLSARRPAGAAARAHAQQSAYFFRLLAEAADYLITRYEVRVIFVPFWPGRDEGQAAQVVAGMRHPEGAHILRGAIPAPVLRALLGEMDAVLALRLHALIFAAAAGVPVIGFTYARKVPAFLAAVGQAERALDPLALDWVRLKRALDSVWTTRPATRRTLLDHTATLREAAASDLATTVRLLEVKQL